MKNSIVGIANGLWGWTVMLLFASDEINFINQSHYIYADRMRYLDEGFR